MGHKDNAPIIKKKNCHVATVLYVIVVEFHTCFAMSKLKCIQMSIVAAS